MQGLGQPDESLRSCRRLVPGGHDPEAGRDLHGCELGLRQPHPILVGHGLHRHQLQPLGPGLGHQQGDGLGRLCLGLKQRSNGGALPARLGWGQARLTIQGLFCRTVGVRILHRHRHAIQLVAQGVRQGLHQGLRAAEGQLEHQRFTSCAATASVPGSGCLCRPHRSRSPPSGRGAGECWCGCLRPRFPTRRCACAPAPARACRRRR